MKFTTLNFAWIALGLLLIANGENIRASVDKGNATKSRQEQHADRIKLNTEEARQAIDLSKVALERAKSCIRIVDAATGKDSYLTEGQTVQDLVLKRPIRPGATVCGSLGDTGITDQKGAIADLARVVQKDMPEYKKSLNIK